MFIIRSYNDQDLRDNSSIELVAVSLAASLFSITNKITWMDREGVDDKAKEPKFKRRWPCVNPYYMLRIIWRFSYVTTRFCVLSLVWSVLGGAFFGIFLAASCCIWGIPEAFDEHVEGKLGAFLRCLLYGLVSLISTPTSERIAYLCIHAWKMVLLLTMNAAAPCRQEYYCEYNSRGELVCGFKVVCDG